MATEASLRAVLYAWAVYCGGYDPDEDGSAFWGTEALDVWSSPLEQLLETALELGAGELCLGVFPGAVRLLRADPPPGERLCFVISVMAETWQPVMATYSWAGCLAALLGTSRPRLVALPGGREE